MLPLLTRLDHVGIACRDLDAAIGLYQATFGLEVVSLEVNEEQGVREAMLGVGVGRRRLAGPVTFSSSSRWARTPRWAGSSPGAARACTTSGTASATCEQALAAIGGRACGCIDERPRHGSMGASIAFLHPADLGGVLTELVQAADPPERPGVSARPRAAGPPVRAFRGFTRTHRIENSEGHANAPE